ncbi:hypothetical protein LF01B1_07750 [Limosilactobacillus fermentum]|uniref:Uncharacterized protein n=1 Tax=Limosilactobacillus fermentum TaxID=1613 RepID=A0ABD0AMQ4_LIMFE|nr:hypothetical protein LF01B1_07750 [Limosilactobacillus fermentum]
MLANGLFGPPVFVRSLTVGDGGHWGYRAPALWPFRPPWAPEETGEKARLLRSPAAGLAAF